MHKTNCMQSIENISIWEVFSSICPYATEYHQSNGIQYYSKFAIVIQAMMFKQMLVRKLFVVRSDASRFTATIYYSLFGGTVVKNSNISVTLSTPT